MSGWIKCSDRLPEEIKADYLIVCESGEVALSEYVYDDTEGWGFWYDPYATHWMPLPSPPSSPPPGGDHGHPARPLCRQRPGLGSSSLW
ncbi:DUF551 domain-containing protein [Pseudomonas putida]|uniref:DUF551 domain-containing protein n=1 Tax=Pseudomonas putida TaxID=303 RepID=UPI003D66D974